MSAADIFNKVWNYALVLRDNGVGYGGFVEQIISDEFLARDKTNLDIF